MAEQNSMHAYLNWTKQRIDEMDECASVLCLGGIRDVGSVIHLPRVRPKEAGAGE